MRKGPLTRTQLVRLTGSTQPTVTRWVCELTKVGLVKQVGTAGRKIGPGRPTSAIDLVKDAVYVGALHIRRSVAEIGVVNGKGEVEAEVTIPFSELDDERPETRISEAAEQLHAMLASLHIDVQQLIGVGVAVSGLVDIKQGIEAQVSFIGDAMVGVNVPVIKQLQKHFTVPLCVETNAWAMAMGEHWFGHKEKDFILLYVDHGVGSALVLNGQLHRGRGAAGEIEHVKTLGSTAQCYCGRSGCLGTKITTAALLADARSQGYTCASQLVRAKGQDSGIDTLFSECAQAIANVCCPLLDLLDLEVVILAGPISSTPGVVTEVQKQLQKQSFAARLHGVRVLPSNIGNRIGLVGAASLVFGKMLQG
jgi:predicted NBD/HSP70 family sugar kinase